MAEGTRSRMECEIMILSGVMSCQSPCKTPAGRLCIILTVKISWNYNDHARASIVVCGGPNHHRMGKGVLSTIAIVSGVSRGLDGWTHVLLEPGDEVVPVLVLLQTSKRHLGARNVLGGAMSCVRGISTGMPADAYLLRILEVLEESVLVPCNAFADVRSGV